MMWGLYLSDNSRLRLTIRAFVILTYPTHPTAHTCGKVAAGSDRLRFYDKMNSTGIMF